MRYWKIFDLLKGIELPGGSAFRTLRDVSQKYLLSSNSRGRFTISMRFTRIEYSREAIIRDRFRMF